MYKVVSSRLELERGKKVITEPRPLEAGKLYVFQVGAFLILGRWFPGFIIQPGRWIDIGKCAVKVLGHVVRTITL